MFRYPNFPAFKVLLWSFMLIDWTFQPIHYQAWRILSQCSLIVCVISRTSLWMIHQVGFGIILEDKSCSREDSIELVLKTPASQQILIITKTKLFFCPVNTYPSQNRCRAKIVNHTSNFHGNVIYSSLESWIDILSQHICCLIAGKHLWNPIFWTGSIKKQTSSTFTGWMAGACLFQSPHHGYARAPWAMIK